MPISILQTPCSSDIKAILSTSKESVFACIGGILSHTIDFIINNVDSKVRLFVLARVEKSKVDIGSFERLINRPNTQVRALKNLNARLLLIDNKFAIFSPTNFSVDALENDIEFEVVVNDKKIVREIAKRLQEYWKQAGDIKNIALVMKDKVDFIGEWVDPLKEKPIEFLSYDDTLKRRIEEKVKENPTDFGCHKKLGDILRRQGELEEALECYSKVLVLRSDWIEPRIAVASLLCDMGKLDKALEQIFEVLKLDKTCSEAYLIASVIYAKRGEDAMAEAAKKEYEKLKANG